MKLKLKMPLKLPNKARNKSGLASSWQLAKTALSRYRSGWKRYVLILAVVAIPANLVSSLSSAGLDTQDSLLGSIATFATVAMNLALIWAVTQHYKTGQVPKLAQAYYEGTASIVRYVLVVMALVVMLLPAAFGASIYIIGLAAGQAMGSTLVEYMLFALVALLLSTPSIYFVGRYALAPVSVVYGNGRPMAALRQSRALTHNRFWPVLGRLAMAGVFMVMVSIPAVALSALLLLFGMQLSAFALFLMGTTLVALPLVNLYMVALYRDLSAKLPAATAPAANAPEPATT